MKAEKGVFIKKVDEGGNKVSIEELVIPYAINLFALCSQGQHSSF